MNNKIDMGKFEEMYTEEYFKKLAESCYNKDRSLPENFSYWYNSIESFGKFKHADVISNQIFTLAEVEEMQKTDNIDKVDWNVIKQILKPTLDKLHNYTTYSIKNGCFSDKFNRRYLAVCTKRIA